MDINLLCIVILLHSAYSQSGSSCFFPKPWHGEYFHLGFSVPLIVHKDTITEKGRCVENFGSHYVMEEEEMGEKCWRCMTIFRKHHNVLQYKESYCETYFSTFSSLCDTISGDSPMYSMFRREAHTEKCPFKGPFTFSYSKGGSGLNTCSFPQSYLDSCMDHHRLQLDFQACIDVRGSESVSEELKCLAHWKEGSHHYLVVEMNRQHVYSDEARYRCFVYEKEGKGENRTIRMAQSLSATCRGLWSPTEGYRTFTMKKVDTNENCRLPSFLTVSHSWSSLDGSTQIHLNSGERSMRVRSLQDSLHGQDSHVTCHSITKQDKTGAKLVTFVKSGCNSGFVCSQLVEEAPGVILLQQGHLARSPGEACSHLYFSTSSVSTSLLVTMAAPGQTNPSPCGMSGRYVISAPTPGLPVAPQHCNTGDSPIHLVSGCSSTVLTMDRQCPSSNMSRTEYSCVAHWTHPTVTNVILSSSTSSQMLCLSYMETENRGWLSSHSCYTGHHHQATPDHTFHISQSAPCVQSLLSSSLSSTSPSCSSFCGLLLLLTLVPSLVGGVTTCALS